MTLWFAALEAPLGCTPTGNGQGTLPSVLTSLVVRLSATTSKGPVQQLVRIPASQVASSGSWLIRNIPAASDVHVELFGCDAAQQIQAATDGGARAVLDLVGATPTVTLAVASSARGGHIVICGLMGGDITLSLPVIPMRPLTLQGSYVGTLDELRELVALVKRTGMKAIPVTRRPLSDANEALQDLHAGRVVGRAILVP